MGRTLVSVVKRFPAGGGDGTGLCPVGEVADDAGSAGLVTCEVLPGLAGVALAVHRPLAYEAQVKRAYSATSVRIVQ